VKGRGFNSHSVHFFFLLCQAYGGFLFAFNKVLQGSEGRTRGRVKRQEGKYMSRSTFSLPSLLSFVLIQEEAAQICLIPITSILVLSAQSICIPRISLTIIFITLTLFFIDSLPKMTVLNCERPAVPLKHCLITLAASSHTRLTPGLHFSFFSHNSVGGKVHVFHFLFLLTAMIPAISAAPTQEDLKAQQAEVYYAWPSDIATARMFKNANCCYLWYPYLTSIGCTRR
jgi:hypothetical protein